MRAFANLFIVLLSFGSIASLQAQGISGRVQEAGGGGLPFVNIVLLKATDSTVVTGAVSNDQGEFEIAFPGSGTYFLRATAMGYRRTATPVFKLHPQASDRSFRLLMEEDRELLAEATVEALQARVISKHDRMVVKVAGTAMAAGSNANELLQNAPGVWSDQNGALQVNGKSGVKVMIDGRDTYLSGEQLQNKLRNIAAEDIEDIEIIHNPSSRYSAEGTGGIINIVLKKNNRGGWAGSVYADYRYSRYHFFNSGANLSYKNNRLNAFANVSLGRGGRWRDMEWYREYNQPQNQAIYTQAGSESRLEWEPSLRTGFEYQLSDRQSLALGVNLSEEYATQDWNTSGKLLDTNAATDVRIESLNHLDQYSFDQNYNLHYRLELDSNGASLSANLDYVHLNYRLDNRFENRYDFYHRNEQEAELLTNHNPYSYQIAAARIDYVQPLPAYKLSLETGIKISEVHSRNAIDFYQLNDQQEELLPQLSNRFEYQEDIFAGYINFDYRVNEQLRLQAGLRAENSRSLGYSSTLAETNRRQYFNLFPSLFVQQEFNENYQLNVSYTRRISRPRYGYLNPYVFYIDPYTSIRGNPYLKPQYTHAVQVNQSFWKKYNLMLGYDHTIDFLSEVPSVDVDSKNTVINHGNVDKFRNLSASLIIPLSLGKKVSINTMFSSAFQRYQTVIKDEYYDNRQLFVMGRSSATVKLPAGLVMEATLNANGPIAHGIYRLEGRAWLNLGLKRSFLHDKLSLNVNFKDVFRTHGVDGSVGLKGNKALIDQYQGLQSLNVSLRYNFSRDEVYRGRQQKLEELQRAGG